MIDFVFFPTCYHVEGWCLFICYTTFLLQQGSRYLGPIFWLGVTLLQFGHMAFCAVACQLLGITIQQVSDRTVSRDGMVEEDVHHKMTPEEREW
jgi:hypothetical protein